MLHVHVQVMVKGKRKYTYCLPYYRPDVPGRTNDEKRANAEKLALADARKYWFRAPSCAARADVTEFQLAR